MTEKRIVSENGKVFYWVSEIWNDTRTTLVFLHGLAADHTMFENQVDYFNGRFNLIMWDAPMHGKSRPYSDFSYQAASEELKKILDENNVRSAVMIGQSFGGYAAQSFLQRYPERVSAFVGIDTTPYGNSYYSKSDIWLLKQIEWMAMLYPLKAMKKAIAKQVSVTQECYANMLTMLEPYGKKELCRLMGIGYSGFLSDNKDMDINCPVMLIAGDRDVTGKVKQYNEAWTENTGFPLKIIKNAAHNSNVDNPEAVNTEIDKFLQSL